MSSSLRIIFWYWVPCFLASFLKKSTLALLKAMVTLTLSWLNASSWGGGRKSSIIRSLPRGSFVYFIFSFIDSFSSSPITGTKNPDLRSQLLERIENLEARTAKVSVITCDDGEVIPTGRSRNVTVFNRHAQARLLQFALLFSPNVRNRSVEAENPSVQRSYKTGQPSLQCLPLPPLFGAHPVGKLGKDHRAGVAVVLFSLEPSYHARVAVALRGLTQHIGIQQPAHNLDRKYSRRRGGRSSMGTGQALSTFNQFGFDAMRRHIKASSSASKSTRKWSPGLAGTAAGTVNRRFESSVTIMVGYSHYTPTVSTGGIGACLWCETQISSSIFPLFQHSSISIFQSSIPKGESQ